MDESPALRWSGAFSVLPASSVGTLRGDKITLPQSALEQLLAAVPSRPATTDYRSYNPFHRGVSTVSPSIYREESQQLPNPLMFRLVNPINNNVVFAGIREFSAPEGTLGLSPFLKDALDIKEDQLVLPKGLDSEDPIDLANGSAENSLQITVHAKQLPKGTYVRLRPLEAGYNPDDWKSLLERQLRESFTTLTKDAVLSVHGVQGEDFQFLVDKFAPESDGICVVDTDLEVDIEALNEEQARETLRQIMSKAQPGSADGSSKGGELDIWKDTHGQVVPGEYVDYVLPSWSKSQPLVIELSNVSDEDSLDLFVTPKSSRQRALPRDMAHVFGNFSPAEHGKKSIVITPTNVELEGAESIQIAVHAYKNADSAEDASTPVSYTIRAKAGGQITSNGVNGEKDVEMANASPDEQQCKNCLQWVPKQTMILHENFCRRNNIVCPHCKSVFKKGSPEWEAHWHCEHDEAHGNSTLSKSKHDAAFHGSRQCPGCEFSTNSLSDLASHRTSVCPGKIILCRFCHLEVPQEGDPFNPAPEVVLSGLTAHELADGARTTECHLCDKIVRLRDMETHLKHHELDKVGRQKPTICRNAICGRTVHGVGPRGQLSGGNSMVPANNLGLCSQCFGPLYVSMHDPEGKALRRRVERRYLAQFMTGCKKSHCVNEWCKTGRSNLGLESKASTSAAALQQAKPLMAELPDAAKPVHFCVDEGNQRGRKLAEMVAAEKVWDLEWCIAAAEAERGDLDKMREWLRAWAPRN